MPGGDPHFPDPKTGAPDPYREAGPAPPVEEKKRVLAKRAEPPPESKPPKAKLTRDEVNALIRIESAKQPRPVSKSLLRSTVMIPLGIVSHILHAAIGSTAYAIEFVVFVAALVWIAIPLFRKDDLSSPR